jgi:hypothetical protein
MDTVSAKLKEAGLRRVVIVHGSGDNLNCDIAMLTDAQFGQLMALLQEARN